MSCGIEREHFQQFPTPIVKNAIKIAADEQRVDELAAWHGVPPTTRSMSPRSHHSQLAA